MCMAILFFLFHYVVILQLNVCFFSFLFVWLLLFLFLFYINWHGYVLFERNEMETLIYTDGVCVNESLSNSLFCIYISLADRSAGVIYNCIFTLNSIHEFIFNEHFITKRSVKYTHSFDRMI